jgi:hypothetical protein
MFTALALNPIEFILFTFSEAAFPAAVKITESIIIIFPLASKIEDIALQLVWHLKERRKATEKHFHQRDKQIGRAY